MRCLTIRSESPLLISQNSRCWSSPIRSISALSRRSPVLTAATMLRRSLSTADGARTLLPMNIRHSGLIAPSRMKRSAGKRSPSEKQSRALAAKPETPEPPTSIVCSFT